MERENKLQIIMDDTKPLKNIQAEQIPAKISIYSIYNKSYKYLI